MQRILVNFNMAKMSSRDGVPGNPFVLLSLFIPLLFSAQPVIR